MFLTTSLLTFVFFCCRNKSIDSPRNTLQCLVVESEW
jgi:hypothetical protein